MQDRFKFKVYHNPTNQIYDVYGFNEHLVFIDTLDTCEPLKRKDCVLMPYLGINDKNGKPIYDGYIVKKYTYVDRENFEGDLIYINTISVGVAHLIPSRGAVLCKARIWEEDNNCNMKLREILKYTKLVASRSEIIGNIYESPELLEILDE